MAKKLSTRTKVLDSLNGAYGRLNEELGRESGLLNVYVQGSLINMEGDAFSESRSDIDLLITTSLSDASKRSQLIRTLKPWIQQVEESLISDLKERDSLPIVGVCIATQFELDEGIHKNRNTPQPYNNKIFLRLGSDKKGNKIVKDEEDESSDIVSSRRPESVGKRLSSDLVDGFFFSAWAVLAAAQSFRSHYADPEHPNNNYGPFNSSYLPLPKDLLRNAYLFQSFANSREPAMENEDDIAVGLDAIRDLLKVEALNDPEAKALQSLIFTHRPSGRGEPLPVQPEQLLYLWELISVKTEEAVKKLRKNSSSDDLNYAADDVLRELIQFNATSLNVVDKAILFFNKSSIWNNEAQVKVLPHKPISFYEFSVLDRDKQISLAAEWPIPIENYLRSLNSEVNGKSKCKVGFAGLLHTQAGIGHPPQIIIRPLTHWVTEKFNRNMIAQPDNQVLQKIRRKYAKSLFRPTGDYECACPSNLYIEVAVITNDLYIPKLSKNPTTSPQGRGAGRPVFTCGIEYSFSWKEHVDEDKGTLRIEKALMDGLGKELNIKPSDIKKWSASSLVIQHSHLNASILGIVMLNIRRTELLDRIGETLNEDDMPFKKVEFIPIQEAYQAVELDRGTGNWHQTALMRINLIDLKRDLA